MTTATRQSRRRKRKPERVPISAQVPAFATRQIPAYALLNEEGLCRLEEQAEWILAEIGIEFIGDSIALDLFREAGATVQGNRVRFDRGHVRKLCSTAPAEFEMVARNREKTIRFGGDHVVFAPAYGPPFVTDTLYGRRYGTIEDFQNFVKLTAMSPWLHHQSGTLCEPVDVPVNKRHLDMVYAHLRYGDKPFMGGVTAPERAQDSIDMACIVFGDRFLEENCVIQGNINANSPLMYDETMSGALRTYAAANQGVVISPFILGGAMSPVTMAGAIAQAHAEAMVGIALSQLVRPGCPVIYGNFLTTMDLKSGAPTFGTSGSMLAAMAIGQLAKRLNLPFRCGGQYTASKTADGQAMQESADAMFAGLMAGANFIFQAAGWLEGGLSIGYEKFVLDVDHLGMLQHFMQGLPVNDSTLATDAFREIEPGGNFLGVQHTIAHFRTANHAVDLADNDSFERWAESGRKSAERRARDRWQSMLREYEAPPIDPAVDEALLDFMARRKASMEDAWY